MMFASCKRVNSMSILSRRANGTGHGRKNLALKPGLRSRVAVKLTMVPSSSLKEIRILDKKCFEILLFTTSVFDAGPI